MGSSLLLLALGATAILAAPSPMHKLPFTHLVTFGDSYTDNGRLAYYIHHNGSAPPPGAYHNETNLTETGGLAWGQLIRASTGVTYLDYASDGATCSNEIISRMFDDIYRPYPSVLDDEIPSFESDIGFKSLYLNRTSQNTLYALWIGTNDLGWDAFLSDSGAPGKTIRDYVECVWSVFDRIYRTGGRRFVLFNQAPLQLAPTYAPQARGGVGDHQYWWTKSRYNETEYSQKMMQYTTAVNTIFEYGAPFQLIVQSRWPGATFTLFDVHSLMTDIYNNPRNYLDAPYNTTGYYHHCRGDGSPCRDESAPRSAFLWWDELHPSARTDEIIAKKLLEVLTGNSTFGTTYTV
ncbi:hypothetical protein GQ53DRAFT_121299 [Thozetella sp. PMI_491]|nr:hypothetical protein GQ53DRAFT_121299 [Thozetella sp. PMI_491]